MLSENFQQPYGWLTQPSSTLNMLGAVGYVLDPIMYNFWAFVPSPLDIFWTIFIVIIIILHSFPHGSHDKIGLKNWNWTPTQED